MEEICFFEILWKNGGGRCEALRRHGFRHARRRPPISKAWKPVKTAFLETQAKAV
jgi:hypothetical protein